MKSVLKLSFYLILLAFALINPNNAKAQLINTIAGDGITPGPATDLSPATATGFGFPQAIFVDKNRNTFFIDQGDNRIYKVDRYGIVHIIANAAGTFGSTGDGGPATAAEIGFPSDLFVDTAGNIFFTESNFSTVRKIDKNGIVSTICGTSGFFGFGGDGGPATAATLSSPSGICGDRAGNIYIADNSDEIVRMINTSGIITTIVGTLGTPGFAGDGSPALTAQLDNPQGISIDTFGKLYIADANNSRIRMVDGLGIITTIAGDGTFGFAGDGAPATAANLSFPTDVHSDQSGNNIYIADNNNFCVRKVNGGIINTVAGTGTVFGFFGDGGLATSAQCSDVSSVCGMDDGSFYLSDPNNTRVRRVAPCLVPAAATPISSAPAVCIGATFTASDATGGGEWTSENTSVFTIDQTGLVTGVGLGAALISYTVDGVCGASLATANVNGRGLAAAGTITGIATVCVSGTTPLTDVTGFGTWSSSNTNASVSSTGLVTGLAGGTSIISYTVTNACGNNSAIRTVTVLAAPTPGFITGAATVCEAGTATLTTSAGLGTWTSGNTAIATITPGGGVVSGVAGGTATISYRVTNICGTTYTTTVITVNPLPTPGTLAGSTTICELFTTSLTPSIGGGAWSSGNTSVATVDVAGTVSGVVPGTATISYAVTNGCGTRYATIVVTVQTTPISSVIKGSNELCKTTTTTLSNGVIGGLWSSSDASIASVSSGGVVTGNNGGTATITYSVINACGTVNATHMITVDTLAVITPIVSTGSSFCEFSIVPLTNATPGGVWSSSSSTTATVSSSGLLTNLVYGSVIASYTITNTCGSSSVTKSVNFIPSPAPVIHAVGKALSTTKKYLTYQWYQDGTPIPGATTATYNFTDPGSYFVDVTGPGGCAGTSAAITVSLLGASDVIAANNDLSVYPNPNNGSFVFNLATANNEPVQVTITNVVGQKVKELTTVTNTDTQVRLDQPPGIYMLSAIAGNKNYVAKVVIQ